MFKLSKCISRIVTCAIIQLGVFACAFLATSQSVSAYVILPEACREDLGDCIKKDKLSFIFVFSEISYRDFEQFQNIDELWPADKTFPKIYVETNGGSLSAAMGIGRILRKRDAYITTANPLIEESKHYAPRCRSACVFIAAGATKRQLGNIGLHDGHTTINWGKKNQKSEPLSQKVDIQLKAYLDEMKIDAGVFAMVKSTHFDDMRDYYYDKTLAGADQDIVRWGFHQFDNRDTVDENTATEPVPEEPSFRDDMKFAVDNGIIAASRHLAYIYASQANGREPNYEMAMRAMRYAAVMEDPSAQHMMGHLLATGKWGQTNIKESREWFLKAAQNGFAGSQNNIGWYYYKGKGVQKSIPLAVHWITRAADGGEPFAYGSLCEMYGAGDVFPYNKQETYKWCKLAALEMPFGKSRDLAVKLLNRTIAKMTEDELAVGKVDVETWKPLQQTASKLKNIED